MTNEEFVAKLNQKRIEELADERVRSVLDRKQNMDVLFRRYYDYFDVTDLDLFKRVMNEAIKQTRSSEAEDNLTADQELLHLLS